MTTLDTILLVEVDPDDLRNFVALCEDMRRKGYLADEENYRILEEAIASMPLFAKEQIVWHVPLNNAITVAGLLVSLLDKERATKKLDADFSTLTKTLTAKILEADYAVFREWLEELSPGYILEVERGIDPLCGTLGIQSDHKSSKNSR